KKKIYNIIVGKLSDPSDLLRIQGFFDECEGRCEATIINKKDKNDSESIKEIVYNRREKAKNHFYCDGRKATPKKTDSTENDELDFWWCANKKCYKPSRQLHTADEWKNYTLLDFLSILKIEY